MATTLQAIQAFVASISLREGQHNGQRMIEVLEGKKVILAYVQASPSTIKGYTGSVMSRGKERRHSTSYSQTPQDVMAATQFGISQHIGRRIINAATTRETL